MTEWSVVQEHKAENITLLCDLHHKEKTNGWLPIEQVREANLAPFNAGNGQSPWHALHFNGPTFTIEMGNNFFVSNSADIAAIVVDDLPLLGVRIVNGQPLLSLILFDDDDHPLFTVIDNELTYTTTNWDVEIVGTRIKVRSGLRQILVDVEFQPANKVVIHRGMFKCFGAKVFVDDKGIFIPQAAVYSLGNKFVDVEVAICIGRDNLSRSVAIALSDMARHRISDKTVERFAKRWAKHAADKRRQSGTAPGSAFGVTKR